MVDGETKGVTVETLPRKIKTAWLSGEEGKEGE